MLFYICMGVVVAFLFLLNRLLSPKAISLTSAHVLVTGGSSGIGKEVAVAAVKRGANVTLFARNETKLAEAKEHVEKFMKDPAKQKVSCISVDVSRDSQAVERAVREAEVVLGPVDILVNSAGNSPVGRFEEIPIDDFRNAMNLNYLGSIYVTRAVVHGMKERRSGRIVFISSQAGQLGVFGYTAYCPTKFALRGLAEALQMELKPFNIRVCLAFPPDTDTPGLQDELKIRPKELSQIAQTSGLFQADAVGRRIVSDAVKGHFLSYMGVDGWMLSMLTAGMSPVTSVVEYLQQVLTMSLIRFISVLYLLGFDRIVAKGQRERTAQEEQKNK